MMKRSRANTEVASSAKVVVFKCRFFFFCEYKNVYSTKINILDNGSEKPN